MLLEKIKEVYGDNLPGKTEFRNDPERPCTVEEISEKFGDWDSFVVEYNKPTEAPKETKEPANPTAGKAGTSKNDSSKQA